MKRSTVQVVALVLLLVQGLMAIAPRQVLCLHLFDCGQHEVVPTAPASPCGHCKHHGGHDHHHAPSSQPTGAPCSEDLAGAEPCPCHLHIAVPDDNQLPTKPSGGEGQEFRLTAVPTVFLGIVHASATAPSLGRTDVSTTSLAVSDRLRSLRTTRIRI